MAYPTAEIPVDGRITSLTALTSGLTGSEVIEIVAPGNAEEGNNYQVTLQMLSDFFTLGTNTPVVVSIQTPLIGPLTDGTTALQITKADLTTGVMIFDTLNSRVGINKTPGAFDLDINGALSVGSTLTLGGNVVSNLLFTDNTYDIGAPGATRPHAGYFGTSITVGAGLAITSSGPGGALTAAAYATYAGPYLPLAGGTLTGPLVLSAGTTTNKPLQFQLGTLLTLPLAGTIEFLTDAYYGTITTGSARKTFAFLESPSFTTPTLDVATATRLGIGQAADPTIALAVTGAILSSGTISVSTVASIQSNGNFITNAGGFLVQHDGAVTLATGASLDTILSRAGSATWQLGNIDAASPVAQTFRVQSVVAGTAAANGANWTLIGSLPTGTGTSGDIILKTGVKTGSGTTQGTPTTALTIKGETLATVFAGLAIAPTVQHTGVAVGSLPTPVTGMVASVTDSLTPVAGVAVSAGGSAKALVWYNGANWIVVAA